MIVTIIPFNSTVRPSQIEINNISLLINQINKSAIKCSEPVIRMVYLPD